METINIQDLKPAIVELIKRSLAGEDLIIEENGKPLAKIISVEAKEGQNIALPKRQPGGWEGKVWMADDFDELPDDIAHAFGMVD